MNRQNRKEKKRKKEKMEAWKRRAQEMKKTTDWNTEDNEMR